MPILIRTSGFASVVGLAISLVIVLLLILLYLRQSVPQGAGTASGRTAIDATRRQVGAFEEQERARLREMDEAAR